METLFSYKLLVSYDIHEYHRAKHEIRRVLADMGDSTPVIEKTFVGGIAGVITTCGNRDVTGFVRRRYSEQPLSLLAAIKWVPVDVWCAAEVDSMTEAVNGLRDRILPGETWGMDLDRHRYSRHHTRELVELLSRDIDAKVNLSHPDKLVRVDIIGVQAGVSVLKPVEIFSAAVRSTEQR